MQDILGQDVKVGSIVIPTNNSSVSYWREPMVVTRLGADKKVQLNGKSYADAAYLIVIDKQYSDFVGFNKYSELINKYQDKFNNEQVAKKRGNNRYVILRLNTSASQRPYKDENITYWIDEIPPTKSELVRYTDPHNLKEKINEYYASGKYVTRKEVYKNKEGKLYSDYNRYDHSLSLKALKEFYPGIEKYIGTMITDFNIIDFLSQT